MFAPAGEGATEVQIDHRGWERLGARGEPWRERNRRGWETLVPWYVEFCQGEQRWLKAHPSARGS